MNKLAQYLTFAPEVQQALQAGQPVVSVASADYTHNLPYSESLGAILQTLQTIRQNQAVPAMIAVLQGKLCIGLTDAELEFLCQKGPQLDCASRRDIPAFMAGGKSAAASVSAAMVLGAFAGIHVLATGGIGGVRQAGNGTIVSADLAELARTCSIVVCSGVLPGFDVFQTLAQLDTDGVTTIGYQSDRFPVCFTPSAGQPISHRVDSPQAAAKVYAVQQCLGLRSGLLLAAPVPCSAGLADEMVSSAIRAAHNNTRNNREFQTELQQQLNQLSAGKSHNTESRMLLQNAALAAQIVSSPEFQIE